MFMKSDVCIAAVCAVLVFTLMIGCGNPFSPPTTKPPGNNGNGGNGSGNGGGTGGGNGGGNGGPIPDATQAEILLENLDFAMDNRDIEVYEDLLDERYWFTERSETDTLDIAWGKDRDVTIITKIFKEFTTFDFDFTQAGGTRGRFTEPKGTVLPAFEGDPDAHEDEDWEVFFGPVNMLMVDETGENGFRVNQNMTFKLRQNEEGLWKIVRWDDDPLTR